MHSLTYLSNMHKNAASAHAVNRTVAHVPSSAQRGFTLTELLVTIVIVALLATLSAVGVSSFRRNAHAAQAISSLRQNAAAIQGFVTDKGRYPEAWDQGPQTSGGGSWSWQIRDYLNYQSTPSWPASSLLHPRHGTKGIDELNGWLREKLTHFSASAIVLQDVEPREDKDFVRAVHVNNPSSTIMLGDGTLEVPNDPSSGCASGFWELRYQAISGDPNSRVDAAALKEDVDFWFNGKAHFIFVDGHVEVLAPEEVLRKHFQL